MNELVRVWASSAWRIAVLTIVLPSTVSASYVTNIDNGHTYLVVPSGSPGTATWLEAFAAAQTYSFAGLTGHLVTITSAAEQDFVVDLIAPYRRYADPFVATTDSFWIGGYRSEAGSFAWVTGEPFIYEFNSFDTDSPYLEMYNVGPPDYPHEVFGNWNDITNGGQGFLYGNGFIVEFETVSAVPEPTSMALLGLASLGGIGLRLRQRRKPQDAQAAA